jgi:two-component system sensor histidine kinase CiaH
MQIKQKKTQSIFIVYWIMLAYIISALVFWYITLNNQNQLMSELKKQRFPTQAEMYKAELEKIDLDTKKKVKQYAGEGTMFFLVIVTGALFFFKTVRRQLKISQEQQNFMIAVTHELKTPIAVAKLNLETLQKRKLDDTQQKRLLYNTLQETNRLDALCNNLLISSQMEAGGYRLIKEKFNLSQLVQTSVTDFAARYPQRVIREDIERDVFITGDATLLQIAVNNLMENALKYSPKNQPIQIELHLQEAKAELKVIDQGGGICDEDKKKVFQKFYRLGNEATKRAKGTGLGLYLTQRIVSIHGGEIAISDNPSGGSIFTTKLLPSV